MSMSEWDNCDHIAAEANARLRKWHAAQESAKKPTRADDKLPPRKTATESQGQGQARIDWWKRHGVTITADGYVSPPPRRSTSTNTQGGRVKFSTEPPPITRQSTARAGNSQFFKSGPSLDARA